MWQLHFPWNNGKQEQAMDSFHTLNIIAGQRKMNATGSPKGERNDLHAPF